MTLAGMQPLESRLDNVTRHPKRDRHGLNILLVNKERVREVVDVDKEASGGRIRAKFLPARQVPAGGRQVAELVMPEFVTQDRTGLPSWHRRVEPDERQMMDVLPKNALADWLSPQFQVRQGGEFLPGRVRISQDRFDAPNSGFWRVLPSLGVMTDTPAVEQVPTPD